MKKNSGSTVSVVTDLVRPIAEELGLRIWDVTFEKEGAMWILRVVIDKDGGVSIDDCEALSRPLDAKLDEVDPIEQSYCLEVSSAGIERELTKDWHYDFLKGETVRVKLIRPIEGEREFIGELSGLVDNEVKLNVGGNEMSFLMNEIAFVKQYAEF